MEGSESLRTTTGSSSEPSRRPARQLTLFEEDPADESEDETDAFTDPDDAWHSTAGGWVPSSGGWGNAGMASPTECWTLSTSEYPSDAAASSLSDILETRPDLQKYYLSPKAAVGILRRAARRQRVLPESLTAALQAVAGQ